MIRLTRISDGSVYWYDKDTSNTESQVEKQDTDPVIAELAKLAEFLKDNNVVEKLDMILRRYS